MRLQEVATEGKGGKGQGQSKGGGGNKGKKVSFTTDQDNEDEGNEDEAKEEEPVDEEDARLASREKSLSACIKLLTGDPCKEYRQQLEQELQQIRTKRRAKWSPERLGIRASRRLKTAQVATAKAKAQ